MPIVDVGDAVEATLLAVLRHGMELFRDKLVHGRQEVANLYD